MKYGQLMLGLLAGCALGAFVSAQNPAMAGGAPDRAAVEQIVRDVIAKEPQLILDSVQKFQVDQRDKAMKTAGDALKDKDTHDKVYNDEHAAYVGPKDAKKVVVEFFDYNCPACKMMFAGLDKLVKENKDVKVIFKEFPIFGPSSDRNSKIGQAVWHLYPERYLEFHAKVMAKPGHTEEKSINEVVKEMGLNLSKLEEDSKNPDYQKAIDINRGLAQKLNIQGTPTLVIGDTVIGHALSYEDLVKQLDLKPTDKPAAEEKPEVKAPSESKPAEPKED